MKLSQMLELHLMLEKMLNEGFKLHDYYHEDDGIAVVLRYIGNENEELYFYFSLDRKENESCK